MRKKVIIITVIMVLVYAVSGFFIAPLLIQSMLPGQIRDKLGLDSTVEEVAVNPFELSVSLRGFEIRDSEQAPLAGFKEFFVNVQSISLIKGVYTFKEIRLIQPYGQIIIRPNGSLNFSDLTNGKPSSSNAPEAEALAVDKKEPVDFLPLQIDLLHIQQGLVEFHDNSKPKPFSLYLVPLQLTLKNFTTQPNQLGTYAIQAEIGDGETLHWEGSLAINPLQSEGEIVVSGIHLPNMWQYVKAQFPVSITDGALTFRSRYRLDASQSPLDMEFLGGELSLTNLKITENGTEDPVITIPSFVLTGINLNAMKRQVTIESLHSQDGTLSAWLQPDGKVNYQNWVSSSSSSQSTETKPSKGPVPPEPEPAWEGAVKDVSLRNYHLLFEDRTKKDPVRLHLDPFTIQVQNVGTQFSRPMSVMVQSGLNEKGHIKTQGTLILDPLGIEADAEVQNMALVPFQPYLDPLVQLRVMNGALNLKGHLRFGKSQPGGSLLGFNGETSLTEFATVDKLLSEDFIKWKNLSLRELSLNINPTNLHIGEIISEQPYARVIIAKDRTVNVSKVLSPPGEGGVGPPGEVELSQENDSEPKTSPPVPVTIKTVRIVNGSANFSDFSLEPNVVTGIQHLNGIVKGLSSEEPARADVKIEGKVDDYAPVTIAGKINPLSQDAFTDISLTFKNVELTTISPYSGNFAGYPIKKGKLSLDLHYKLSQKALEAENLVHIDQLTLGEATHSPSATSLPVKLAIALLKDRQGNIDINMPVSGNLNDPDFHYGKLLLNVLKNLITKIVTSPFAALGSLLGENAEDYQFIEFEPGSADLSLPQIDKLNGLTRALLERPTLSIEITGGFSLERDQGGLAEADLLNQLRQRKIRNLQKSGKDLAMKQEDVVLTQEEYQQLMREAYQEKFGKTGGPGEVLPSDQEMGEKKEGQAPQKPIVPPEIMKKRLLENMAISEERIRTLAQERAKGIKRYLIEKGQIPPDHVFLLNVEAEEPSDRAQVRSRLSLVAH